MASRKIPDDVFQNRCRWCIQGRTENENREIPEAHLFVNYYHDTFPCNIMGINQCDRVPGECLSFHPNWIYGICGTCYWSNQFHDGFCRHEAPENKRVVFLGGDYCGDNGYWAHYRSTCDRYMVNPRLKDLILRDVLRGKSPANFDPDTWEPIGNMEESPAAEEWRRLREQAQQEQAEAEAKRKEAQKPAEDQQEEQMTLF